MKIRGRDVRFLRTVKTACDIADLCPDKDLNRIGALFSGSTSDITKNGAKLIHFMNEGYEMSKHFDDPSYKPNPISEEEILYLDDDTYQQLFNEMMSAFMGDVPTVEAEESKKNESVTSEG